jgi:hypothetical protein
MNPKILPIAIAPNDINIIIAHGSLNVVILNKVITNAPTDNIIRNR